MKVMSVIYVLVLLSGATLVAAEPQSKTDLDLLRQKIKADKKLLVAENMNLTDAESKTFWPLYEEYQQELQQINRRLGATIETYAEALNKGSVPPDTADRLIDEALAVDKAEIDLKRKYANKMAKVIPPAKAARYIQIENKIRALIKAELAREIPLIH